MVKVYAIALVVGVVGLVAAVISGGLASKDRLGLRTKMVVGAVVAFGMAGMSAEFAPVDLSWPVALVVAAVAGVAGAFWVRYATGVATR